MDVLRSIVGKLIEEKFIIEYNVDGEYRHKIGNDKVQEILLGQ